MATLPKSVTITKGIPPVHSLIAGNFERLIYHTPNITLVELEECKENAYRRYSTTSSDGSFPIKTPALELFKNYCALHHIELILNF